jgi:glycosyltransferase involved in cell wall biosynthesis
VFPTFSDGFGLTQLEAQAWILPIITTNFCGKLVEDEQNVWFLLLVVHNSPGIRCARENPNQSINCA